MTSPRLERVPTKTVSDENREKVAGCAAAVNVNGVLVHTMENAGGNG